MVAEMARAAGTYSMWKDYLEQPDARTGRWLSAWLEWITPGATSTPLTRALTIDNHPSEASPGDAS